MTKDDAQALANFLHRLRPEWSIPSMMRLLGEHRNEYDYRDLSRAALNVALDDSKRTPGIIFLDGKHWDQPEQPRPAIPAGPACEDHSTYQAHNCQCCIADVKVGIRPQTAIGKHHNIEEDS